MNVISFSGGRTSAYLCYLALERFGRDNCKFIYCDTGAEHPKTYEFIRKVNDLLKLDLICLKTVFNPVLGEGNSYQVVDVNDLKYDLSAFSAMMAKYGTPYLHGAFCTGFLKTNPFKDYCKDSIGDCTKWLGIRIDEPKRLKEMRAQQLEMFDENDKIAKFRYLAEISDFEKQDVLGFWKSMPFDLELQGDILGNCMFCIKRGPNKLALAARYEPEFAKDFINATKAEGVRITNRKKDSLMMYRDDLTLSQIIKTYSILTSEEIEQSIRSMKQLDTGSCSESCEAFSSDNYDMFEE